MSSQSTSPSSTDSLYAPPSPRTLHRIAQTAPMSQYISSRDVPHLSLDGAASPVPHRRQPPFTTSPPTTIPPPFPHYYPHLAGLPDPPPYPTHREPLRVVSRNPPPLSVPPTAINGHSRIRVKKNPTRGRIDFTDPFAEKAEQPNTGLHAPASETRTLLAATPGPNPAPSAAFYATSDEATTNHYPHAARLFEAGTHPGSFHPLPQAPPTHTHSSPPAPANVPPPGRVCAGPLRLPACAACSNPRGTRQCRRGEGAGPRLVCSKAAATREPGVESRTEFWGEGACAVRPAHLMRGLSASAAESYTLGAPLTAGQDGERGGMQGCVDQQRGGGDAQWDDVDLSDDEWEKVAGDEGAEWEVVEKYGS